MEGQLSMLIELQEIDTHLRGLAEQKDRLPEALASLDRKRAANQEELARTKEGLQAAQKNKRDRDQDLETAAQKIEKLKARSTEIKTNKEYQAVLKEIETAELEKKTVEDEILALMEKIDASAAAITAAESKAKEEEAAIDSEQKEHEAAIVKVEQELTATEQKRQETAARVDPSLLSQYQKLLVSKAGFAIAEARGESCSGCYMSIPPQVYVNVKRNETIINCPHCGRILYFKEAITPKKN